MSTIHNPSNFEPSDYEVYDYLDNKRPEYVFGIPVEAYVQWVREWEADNERALGADWRAKIHRCVHCGNGNVRWITVVAHIPTGDRIVFGADCTKRLGFKDKHAFKLAQLQAKDEARKIRFTILAKRQAYLEQHPEIVQALADVDKPEHSKNFFVQDVLRKLDQYGDLSEKQAAAVVASLAREREAQARKAAEALEPKGEAPVGRVEVSGTVLTVKHQESDFGTVTKILLKLENNSKVWVTRPAGSGIERGDVIRIKATFEQSKDDKSFSFGKRPTFLGKVQEPPEAAVA